MGSMDSRGVVYSTDSWRTMERFESAVELLNGYFGDPLAVIDAALAEKPDFVMGHCFRAGLMAVSTEKTAEPELRRSVESAEALAGRANDRERLHIAAARFWLDGNFERAVRQYGEILIEHPHDLLAIQLAHLGDFYLGQSSMLRDRLAQVLPYWHAGLAGYGFLLGMHAFGLEENGDYCHAEVTGRRALELNRRDPWAVHAVAHVYEMQGRVDDGIEWLTSQSENWAPDNAFAYHNWWHLALYYLDRGDTDRVFELYDTAIRPDRSDVALEMVDASALLWRLHIAGVDVGARWSELADSWSSTLDGGYYAFNDVHAMMAFVGDGRTEMAKRLLTAMRSRVDGTGTNAMMTREVGLPVCLALRAFGNGDFDMTVDTLLPVRTTAHRFGGSHAQRDVVGLTLCEAALRGSRPRLARALTAERTSLKPGSVNNWKLAARSLVGIGDSDGVRSALANVTRISDRRSYRVAAA